MGMEKAEWEWRERSGNEMCGELEDHVGWTI